MEISGTKGLEGLFEEKKYFNYDGKVIYQHVPLHDLGGEPVFIYIYVGRRKSDGQMLQVPIQIKASSIQEAFAVCDEQAKEWNEAQPIIETPGAKSSLIL